MGGLRAEQNQQSLTRFRTHKTGALLAYLAYFPDRLHPRDALADLLWPEDAPEDARASLRTALNSLRKQLEPPGVPAQSVLVTDRSFIRLKKEVITTDVGLLGAALQEARQAVEAPVRAGHLSRAVQIYRGELLPGFYEDWVLQGRRQLEEAYAGALRQLRAYHEEVGDLTQALDYALRTVALDAISEEAHVDVIRLFRKAGRPKEAIQQYDVLTHLLQE
ncbi:MAG: transcriptional activator, partial [Chthonomonadales bacterium]|nr:transcriptional activator [Chthonomonadales bacterium]